MNEQVENDDNMDTFYGFTVTAMDGTRAIVLAANSATGILTPMLYGAKQFNKQKEEILDNVKQIATKCNIAIELVRFDHIKTLDVFFPESMTTH